MSLWDINVFSPKTLSLFIFRFNNSPLLSFKKALVCTYLVTVKKIFKRTINRLVYLCKMCPHIDSNMCIMVSSFFKISWTWMMHFSSKIFILNDPLTQIVDINFLVLSFFKWKNIYIIFRILFDNEVHAFSSYEIDTLYVFVNLSSFFFFFFIFAIFLKMYTVNALIFLKYKTWKL